MSNCLSIVITDLDPDYLGIEIFASNARFSGTTRIYAGLNGLTQFAESIAGFPVSLKDRRRHVFGTKDKGFAGGYCAMDFFCRDRAGHAAVEIELEDDDTYYSEASARFTFPVLPADVDRFVRKLRLLEKARSGEAKLESEG